MSQCRTAFEYAFYASYHTPRKEQSKPHVVEINTRHILLFRLSVLQPHLAHDLQLYPQNKTIYSYGKHLVHPSRGARNRVAYRLPGLLGRRVDPHPACPGGDLYSGEHNPG